ncbi:MAG: hypothetical protein KDC54_05935 [Lewinella sp.]|nr:hypothetical protein [Lewinella sp.]
MKRWIFGLVAILALSMTSCLEMMEEITLNRDGSGIYELKFDMSALFSDPFMAGMMAEAMQEEGADEIEIDSMINMASNLSSDATARERELANRIEARLQMSQSKELGLMSIKFPFEKVSEINEFQQVFSKMNEGDGGGMSGLMGGGMTPNSSVFSLDGRTLTRSIPDMDVDLEDVLDDETMAMMKMMFADASWSTTYHLPGRVRNCDIEGAEVDGKTVVVSLPFLELIEEQPNMGGSITFRRR